LYLTIGRNLALGKGYTYHGLPHSLAYPGMPWLFAGLFKVFGTGTLLPADVVMLGCAFATLALVYRLFLLHAGRPTAVLMTVALAPFTRPLRKGWVILGVGFVAAAVVAGVLFHAMDPRRGHQTDAGDYERVFLQTLSNDPRGLLRTMLGHNLPEILHPAAAEAVFGFDFGHVRVGPWWVPVGVVPSLLSIGAGLLLL